MPLSLALQHQRALFRAYPRLTLAHRFRPYFPSSPLSSPYPTICPSCGAPLPIRLLACPKCSHIERPPPGDKYDYYDLLEAPKSPNPFVVNERRLKNNFRRVQRYVHPDLWATQGEDKTRVARDLSGLVNEAYNTLLQPLSRIQYILSQHNLGVSETDQLDDPHLITEVIEMREALEDASSESEVEGIKENVAKKISDTLENIEHAVLIEDWREAQRGAVRLKYLRGIETAAQSGDDRRSVVH